MTSSPRHAMYAAIELPHLPLQAAARTTTATPPRTPVAILDSGADNPAPHAAGTADEPTTDQPARKPDGRVIDLNRAARAAGVEPGMSAAQARARCARLQLLARRPDLEQQLHDQLLGLATDHSPDLESTAPGIVTIDLAHRPAPPADYAGQILRALGEQGLHARAGLATEPDPARLAAAIARPLCQLHHDPPQRLAQLANHPIDLLPLAPAQRQTLALWGIHTLGQFARLPAAGLAERLGADAPRWQALARGHGHRLLRLHRAPESLHQTIEPEHPLDRLDPLLFLLRRLLDTLLARVLASWRSVEALHLELRFEDHACHRARLPLAEPSNDPTLLLRLLQTHLETLAAPAPLTAARLELKAGQPLETQRDLFHRDLRAPNRFAETLARLQALLGPDQVGRPRLANSHRPDSFHLDPYPLTGPGAAAPARSKKNRRPRTPAPQTTAATCTLAGPPLRRFRPPLPARVDCDPGGRPLQVDATGLRGRVHQCRGPWPLSGQWWDDHAWQLAEWDVQLGADGPLCRLARHHDGWVVCGIYD